MTKSQAKKIEAVLETIDIDCCLLPPYSSDYEDIEDYADLTEHLEDNNLFDVEIIYHARAMEYLAENDPSLYQSLELASDMGYETANLGSEILASLLASELVRTDYHDLEGEIDEILE